MTIAELISKLQEMDQDMLVVKTRYDGRNFYYETMDGWWPRHFTIKRTGHINGIYVEDKDGVEALTI